MRTLTFTLREMENHWRILSIGVTGSDIGFNRIPLDAVLKITAGRRDRSRKTGWGSITITQVRKDGALDQHGGGGVGRSDQIVD